MKPKHYADMPVEPLEVIRSVLTYEEFLGFLKGNAIKYAMRAGKKKGSDDIAKFNFYQEELMDHI